MPPRRRLSDAAKARLGINSTKSAPPLVVDDGSDPVLDYAKAVVSGTEVAGPHVRAACQRHLNDLEHGPKRGLTWDRARAKYVIRFFEAGLRLSGAKPGLGI